MMILCFFWLALAFLQFHSLLFDLSFFFLFLFANLLPLFPCLDKFLYLPQSHELIQFLQGSFFDFFGSHLKGLLWSDVQFVLADELFIGGHAASAELVDLLLQAGGLIIESGEGAMVGEDSLQHAPDLGKPCQFGRVAGYGLKLGQITATALPDEIYLLLTAESLAADAHLQVSSTAEQFQSLDDWIQGGRHFLDKSGKQGEKLWVQPCLCLRSIPLDQADQKRGFQFSEESGAILELVDLWYGQCLVGCCGDEGEDASM